MDIAVCITTFNEEGSITRLLDALLSQTKRPKEIIIVDNKSTDKTPEIVRHYQKKDGRIKFLSEKCSRAKGRNYAVEIAKSGIIAMTDAGCIPDKNWLKNLTSPFEDQKVDVAAGFYKMTGETKLQKAMSFFLGVSPRKFNMSFLPSTRSIAFKKEIWEEVGGFPEDADGTAEDTIFNLKLVKNEAKIARVKNAVVEWGMPASIKDFFWKIFNYAKGDAKSKIIIFPKKGLTSHNIKAMLVILRYLTGLSLFIYGLLINSIVLPYLFILFLIYLIWAYRKVYLEFNDVVVGVWGVVLQLICDIGVIGGFISGLFKLTEV